MSKQAQRFQPTKRHVVRVSLTARELAAEVTNYRRVMVTR
jgi:hypothetical protein